MALNPEIITITEESFVEKLQKYFNKIKWFKQFQNRKTNSFIYIKADGTKVINPKIKNLQINFYGRNNHVEIHEPITIDNKLYISCINNSKVIIKTHNMYKTMKIYAGSNSNVFIDANTSAENVIISMANNKYTSVNIGANCMLSYGILLRTSDGHSIYDTEQKVILNHPADITIGNHVWISADSKILKGVKIPDNCVIGTNSVVTRKFTEENCIIAGNPASVVKHGINWIKSAQI